MPIIRVFPRWTNLTPRDDHAFIGHPPMEQFRPTADEVHISVTFTWDIEKGWALYHAWRQYYDVVKIGGPAFDDPGGESCPGMYLKPGVMTTSRGCNDACPWCLVHVREGKHRLVPYTPGSILQDNNFLQSPAHHIDEVFNVLSGRPMVLLTGGLEAARITDDIADRIRGLRIRKVFMASDTAGAIKPLRRAAARLSPLGRTKLYCYVLLAYGGETISQAAARLEDVWGAGVMPFAILYQPPGERIKYSPEWTKLQKYWIRPAHMVAAHGGQR